MSKLYKKTSLVLAMFAVLYSAGLAQQKPLTPSRQSSYYTYIYKISDDAVFRFYKYPNKSFNDNALHNPVDSFKTGTYWDSNVLKQGNYVKVYVEKNLLHYKLIERRSVNLKLIDNKYDLRLVLVDALGNLVKDARVAVGDRIIPFDAKTGLYHSRFTKKDTIVRADYAGVTNYFCVKQENEDKNNYDHKNWLETKWAAIKRAFNKKRGGSKYDGFVVFNKPKYKPYDTVKFKAFIISKSSKKPINALKVNVVLHKMYSDERKLLGSISSYHEGSFSSSFVLNDSLKLQLDQRYEILLEKIPTSNKSGHNDINSRKGVYISSGFKYEDYELKSIKFKMRVEKTEQTVGVPFSVFLGATDENDLPVADGRVTLTLTSYGKSGFNIPHLFVPDTLWVHRLKLDPVGETRVVIPDSIFPKVVFNYEIRADFLNSNNEHHDESKTISYSNYRYNIQTKLNGDTLLVSCQDYGKEIKGRVVISGLNADDDTLSKVQTTLPAKVIINPNIVNYNIETDSTEDEFEMRVQESLLSINASRTADSLFVDVKNSRHIHFWYSVFSGNRLIDAGDAVNLNYRRGYREHQLVTFFVNYIWAGEMKTEQMTAAYHEKILNINVKQPANIYPGQQVTSVIVVTDAHGKPVPNTDLTAWSLTHKFDNYYGPGIPYMGEIYHPRKEKQSLATEDPEENGTNMLKWKKWSSEIGLDSIAYFQFTHPSLVYRDEETTPDTITQIAPFVVKNGDIDPVHVLYIDERPVYFSRAQQEQHYSFRVNPGKHSLRFRTLHASLKIDTVFVERAKKLIMSVNEDSVQITKESDTLNFYETRLLNDYMITMVNNFGNKMALLEQGKNIIRLNNTFVHNNEILTGPLSDNYASLEVQGHKPDMFLAETGYSYLFLPGLLKQKSMPVTYPVVLSGGADNYTQYALTKAAADSTWQQYLDLRSNSQQLFYNSDIEGPNTGKLTIERTNDKKNPLPFIKNVILYRYDDPDFARIYAGSTTEFGKLAKGKYRVLFLLKSDTYDLKENIEVRPYGINFYKLPVRASHAKDSLSIKIDNVINNRISAYDNSDASIENDALKIKEAFNDKYMDTHGFNKQVAGRVIGADDKLPIVGCTVKIKGTNYGAITDVNGNFVLNIGGPGKLIITYVGYVTDEIPFEPGNSLKIVLVPTSNSLKEVVVVGYGSVARKNLTGSIVVTHSSQFLQGSAAGVSIVSEGIPGAGSTVFIRGITSFGNSKPLIIVDGEPVNNLNINPDDVIGIQVLRNSAATALYGSLGANGVIIITTKGKKGSVVGQPDIGNQRADGQSIRKDFSDYAYWQPKLITDENGRASFTTIFPDDITNWRTFVIAINGQKQSGLTEGGIKSFKPISANFVSPQFTIRGDQINVIGKIMNYTNDTVGVTRNFSYNGKAIMREDFKVANSHIDTMSITAEGADSLTFEYSIKRGADYFDGEQRKIPLIEQGTQETRGIFEALEKDTTLSLHFDPAMGPVTFRAEASVLPALLAETEKLRTYQYLCNEQLASKLIGLLAEKRIKAFLKAPFKWDKNIEQLIKKLLENRRADGTWGWWKNTDEEPWINLHVIEAFIEAKQQGFYVELDGQKLVDFLVLQLESYKGADKLTCLETLKKLNVKVDYQKYCDSLSKHIERLKDVSKYDKFRLILLKQQAGIPVLLDSVLNTMHHTMFGNIYWGEESYRFFDNSIQLSVLAYKIVKNEGKHPELLQKIRGYFLEQRRTGDWRNTYETSLILETILPDVLNEGAAVKPAAIALSGAKNENVTRFPYSTTFNANDLNLSKSGTLPVYIIGYQQFWNKNPQKVSKDFTVDSWFEKKGDKITKLKGGEAVELKVEVKVKGDADYVMINIPIPAGCSYESKDQYWQNEVHREYFKDRVSIFSRKLKQGTYVFTVKLMPRYGGTYHLNPAKAEMMYFPVFYGREGMKKVAVE